MTKSTTNRTTTNRCLILASSSPRRQELIRTLGIPFTIQAPSIDESISTELLPSEAVEEIALRKANTIHDQLKEKQNVVIIGSDTLVFSNGEALGKPVDEHHAFRMLSQLQGTTHEVYTAIACVDAISGESLIKHRSTSVHLIPLTDKQILTYIQTGEPMDKAGAYGIQGLGSTIVDHIEGDYFAVVGLSLNLLTKMLQHFQIEIL